MNYLYIFASTVEKSTWSMWPRWDRSCRRGWRTYHRLAPGSLHPPGQEGRVTKRRGRWRGLAEEQRLWLDITHGTSRSIERVVVDTTRSVRPLSLQLHVAVVCGVGAAFSTPALRLAGFDLVGLVWFGSACFWFVMLDGDHWPTSPHIVPQEFLISQ